MYPPILESQRPSIPEGIPFSEGGVAVGFEIRMRMPRDLNLASPPGHIQVLIRRQLTLESLATHDLRFSPDREVIYLPWSALTLESGREFGVLEITHQHVSRAFSAGGSGEYDDDDNPIADGEGQVYTIQVRFGKNPLTWVGAPTTFAQWRADQVARAAFGEWSNTQRVFVFAGSPSVIFPTPTVTEDLRAGFSWEYNPVSVDALAIAKISYFYTVGKDTFHFTRNIPFESKMGEASGRWGAAGTVDLDVARFVGITCVLTLITVNNTISSRLITGLQQPFWRLGMGTMPHILGGGETKIVQPLGEETEDGVIISKYSFGWNFSAIHMSDTALRWRFFSMGAGVSVSFGHNLPIWATIERDSGQGGIVSWYLVAQRPPEGMSVNGEFYVEMTAGVTGFDGIIQRFPVFINLTGDPLRPPGPPPGTGPRPLDPSLFQPTRFTFFRIDVSTFSIIPIYQTSDTVFVSNQAPGGNYTIDFEIRDHTIEMGAEYIYIGMKYDRHGHFRGIFGPIHDPQAGYSLLEQFWAPRGYPGFARNMDFKGISFLTTKLNQLRLQGNVQVRNFNRVVTDQIAQTIGGQYPFFSRTGQSNHRTISINAMISINFDPTRTFLNLTEFFPDRERWWENDLKKREGYFDVEFTTSHTDGDGEEYETTERIREYAENTVVQNEDLFHNKNLSSNIRRIEREGNPSFVTTDNLPINMANYISLEEARIAEHVALRDRLLSEVPSIHAGCGFLDEYMLPEERYCDYPDCNYHEHFIEIERIQRDHDIRVARIIESRPYNVGALSGFAPSFRQDITPKYESIQASDRIYIERRFRDEVMKWLTDGKPKIFRSETEGNMIVVLSGVSFSPFNASREVYTFSATLTEVAEFNMRNLVLYDLIPSDFSANFVDDPAFLQNPDNVSRKELRFFPRNVVDPTYPNHNRPTGDNPNPSVRDSTPIFTSSYPHGATIQDIFGEEG